MSSDLVAYLRNLLVLWKGSRVATEDAFKQMMASNEAVDRPDLLVSFEEINALVGFETLTEMEWRYAVTEADV